MTKQQITKEQIEEFFKKNFYISNELLTYYTLISLNLMQEGRVRAGQDIYTTTLDGPPGAGKSMYAKLYAKMVHELLNEETVLISYQCDDSTSKIELFEDINVGAAVASEPEKVNIPGVLARAINEVNKGKKVILFIDEYDKTREQVDSLFLQMLQDGIINTNQFGDLKIKDEYKGNIQVIFCKNDFRTELTGPLTRRTRMVYLDIIKPSDFRALAMRVLFNETDNKQEETIINLVSLLYEEIYNHKDEYKRVCATSELFGAIEDLTYLSRIEAPNYILYETLLYDLFKNEEDKILFESLISKIKNQALKNTLTALNKKDNEAENIKIEDIINSELISQIKAENEKMLKDEKEALAKKEKELESKKAELEQKKSELEAKKVELEQKKSEIEKYLQELEAKFSTIVAKQENASTNFRNMNEFALNFDDARSRIKRGHHIFEVLSNRANVATLSIPLNNINNEKLVTIFLSNGAIVYENGFYFSKPFELIMTRTIDIDNKVTFNFYMDQEFLNNDAKKSKDISYSNIKNMLQNIINLILSLNESNLHESDLSFLDNLYKNNKANNISSPEPKIYERVLKKVDEDNLPF